MNDVLNDALSNLERDNYERSYAGYEKRLADVALIRAALAAQPAASTEPVAWVAADTLNSPHPTCISSLAYMSQFDQDRDREYVPLYAAPVAALMVPDVDSLAQIIREVDGNHSLGAGALAEAIIDRITATQSPVRQHPDDVAVDRFAVAMKKKLAAARAKGRGGWDDPEQCSVEFLAELLARHTAKGNPGNFIDVANFAMMLHMRDADPSVMPSAFIRSTAPAEIALETDLSKMSANYPGAVDWTGSSAEPAQDELAKLRDSIREYFSALDKANALSIRNPWTGNRVNRFRAVADAWMNVNRIRADIEAILPEGGDQ